MVIKFDLMKLYKCYRYETLLKSLKNTFLKIFDVSGHFRPIPAIIQIGKITKIIKKSKTMHRFSIIVSCIYALWTAYSFSKFLHRIQYFWHSPPQAASANSLSRLLGGAAMARRRRLQYYRERERER